MKTECRKIRNKMEGIILILVSGQARWSIWWSDRYWWCCCCWSCVGWSREDWDTVGGWMSWGRGAVSVSVRQCLLQRNHSDVAAGVQRAAYLDVTCELLLMTTVPSLQSAGTVDTGPLFIRISSQLQDYEVPSTAEAHSAQYACEQSRALPRCSCSSLKIRVKNSLRGCVGVRF